MKKSLLKWGFALFLLGSAAAVFAQRTPLAETPAPKITSVQAASGDPKTAVISFELDTPRDKKSGYDKGEVVITGPQSLTLTVGSTRRAEKTAEFSPSYSGTYVITVYGFRSDNEADKKASEPYSFRYSYPLAKPALGVLNAGKGTIRLSWDAVKEAEGYVVRYTNADGKSITLPQTKELTTEVDNLKVGQYSDISVAAVRGTESVSSDVLHKLVKDEVEREWQFAWFGTSTGADRNSMKLLDPDNLTVQLNSCTYDANTGGIKQKGGKFTAYYDGVSFYYTALDPRKENFVLKATVHIDYENPATDGQEGFAVYALDRIGQHANTNAYPTNSAGIVSTKYTAHVNGVKSAEIKNGVGARFVTGITDEVLALGDAGISQNAVSKGQAFSYDSADKVRTGRTYNVELRKDNTGYHAILVPEVASEGAVYEYILYDPYNEKLLQLDKDHIYVGFAVARGTNATFSNVSLVTSDPKTDPPAQEEPPELLPLEYVVDSPTTYYNKKYPFVFRANSDGKLTVTDDKTGKVYINNASVKADTDFTKTIKFKEILTDLLVEFTPDEHYFIPGTRSKPKTVIAQYNRETELYEQNYKTVSLPMTVICKSYKGKQLYVAPDGYGDNEGNVFHTGTKDSPLDLLSALQYVSPGQEIVLRKGTYYPSNSIVIERGNSGTKKKRKVLRGESGAAGERAVIDFSRSAAKTQALVTWGDYWTFKDFDVCNARDNIKGFQIGGNYNILNRIDAYFNGDTGIQISGRGTESFDKWPAYNEVINCTSYGNCDPAENNADGFAAKLTVADGNVFRGCIAYCNIDDGWDLFAKVESGPIGAVLIENCITFRNGTRIDGTGHGDGNGFKMGGENINVPHILRNSISFDNTLNGVTSNSNPGLIVENVISYNNAGSNIDLYSQKGLPQEALTGRIKGLISAKAGNGDLKTMVSMGEGGEAKMKELSSESSNYFCFGGKPTNGSNESLEESEIFKNTATASFQPKRKADGSIDMQGLLELTDKAPKNAGARF